MHTTKIIKSRTIKTLTLAASLAAITIVTGSEGAFAGCNPRDHRTVCDPNPPKVQPIQNPTTTPTVVAPTVRQGGRVIYQNDPSERIVIGTQKDGTPIYDKVRASEKTYQRINKDGSIDLVHEFRKGDGPMEVQVLKHKPPKHVDLGSCPFWGC
jgi:hypothetical protein